MEVPQGAFGPLELRDEASLNGTLLAALTDAEPDWIGRPALQLTSLPALQARAAADRVATLGRGLGHLIATLRLAPPSSPYHPDRTPSAWRAAYLRHWARVERIWLGGGLMAAFGTVARDYARAEAERLGLGGCPIELAPHADVLGLLGLARSRRAPPPVAVVLDFGNTAVKRGVALAAGGVIQQLVVLPPIAAPSPEVQGTPAAIRDFVMQTIQATIHEAKRDWGNPDASISACLAAYIVENKPIDRGTYGALGRIEGVTMVHDGTAAARGLLDAGNDGLIVVGTYLGAGFPPPANHLAPLATDFRIQRLPCATWRDSDSTVR